MRHKVKFANELHDPILSSYFIFTAPRQKFGHVPALVLKKSHDINALLKGLYAIPRLQNGSRFCLAVQAVQFFFQSCAKNVFSDFPYYKRLFWPFYIFLKCDYPKKPVKFYWIWDFFDEERRYFSQTEIKAVWKFKKILKTIKIFFKYETACTKGLMKLFFIFCSYFYCAWTYFCCKKCF